MNVRVSSSNTPIAHPPRSNPPLRSSSDAAPFPCITPSTVTCVMVVSFMGFLQSGLRREAEQLVDLAGGGGHAGVHARGEHLLHRLDTGPRRGDGHLRAAAWQLGEGDADH